ncbi:acyltransferase [Leekyejoonella antrihumi]|nr:acyltransferase [Leekyejoonella antrihumi]
MSKHATQIKGNDYRIDSNASPGYILTLATARGGMKLRGTIAFPGRDSKPFIASGVTIKERSKIHFGSGVSIGPKCYIDALSTNGVKLGSNSSVGRNTRIECTGTIQNIGKGMTVGENVGLGTDCLYGAAGGIEIGDDSIIGNFVSFHSENHQISDLEKPIRLQGVTRLGISVGRDCWIGAKATILDGAHIGDGCVIAAGSVVIAGEYRSMTIYGGVPAKEIGSRIRPKDRNEGPPQSH